MTEREVIITWRKAEESTESKVVMHYDDLVEMKQLTKIAMRMRPDKITIEFERG